MLDFNYVSEVVFKQIEIPLSRHTRINPTFVFWWNGQVHRLRPRMILQSARDSQDVCISLQLDDSAAEVFFDIRMTVIDYAFHSAASPSRPLLRVDLCYRAVIGFYPDSVKK
jgi:hypothetical protein